MNTLRRVAVSLIALGSVTALSACTDTNFSAQTNQRYQAAEGANKRGDVNAMNTVVVTDQSEVGVISAALVNKSDAGQTLREVTAATSDGQELAVTGPKTELKIPSGDLLTLGDNDESKFVVQDVPAGTYVTVTFSFVPDANTDPKGSNTVIETPTVERSETYADVVGVQ